jgi:hypothetical protein
MMALIVAAFLGAFGHHVLEGRQVKKVHRLEFPLMLTGSGLGGRNYLLPKGTVLYYEQAFPEGFVRYRVYVNVEGVDLKSSVQSDPTSIEPMNAYPIDRAELDRLLGEYPLSRDDVASILKSGVLSREEIRSLLAEFSDQP